MGYVGSGRPVGRPKQFYKYELPHGVIKVVSAQCADYKRKQLAISEGALPQEILDAYIATNAAIDKALDDIEVGCRADFLVDIAENRGYERSKLLWLLSRHAYYNRKRKAIYDIARGLRLV